MKVVKRDGREEPVHFDKITERISKLMDGLNTKYCDPTLIAQKVCQGIYHRIPTTELDTLAAETAAYLSTSHPDYGILAARIAASNLQKCTPSTFSQTMKIFHELVHPKTGVPIPLISDKTYAVIERHAAELDAMIVNERDLSFDFFSFKTLERSYLFKVDGKVFERPQYMFLRTAVGMWGDNMAEVKKTYDGMSLRKFIHATPTLFNAGTPRPQMSSCFLLTMKDDSIGGIYETLSLCAKISKYAGGIGLAIHNIRANGSYVAGTNGNSNGLVPMLRVFDATARYVDQGGGKRKGSFAMYLEPWHFDIEDFLDLKKNTGKEEQRARDLFYAVWVSSTFMKRVEADEEWSLFCPNEARGLSDVWGEEFERLYEKYEQTPGLARKKIRARELFFRIIDTQIETGTPYFMYKDACNQKSNHNHLGTIKSSNLCCEIVQYTSPDEVAVCNLASISLPAFVDREKGTFDHEGLREVARQLTRNLNRVIDENYYPVEEAERSNKRHRPIGLGVQGLWDAFVMLRYPYDSEEARKLNRDIFETIYYGACTASLELAKKEGPYETFQGSMMSRGIFQFDLWETKPNPELGYDWDALRQDIMKHGMRNSLLVAPMPTASTSQILGNTEGTEVMTSNIYNRRTLAGEFPVVNRHLVNDLIDRGLWNTDTKNAIVAAGGSIQNIPHIDDQLKALYKTVWEIKQRVVVEMAAERGAFIDQSQSMNIHLANPTRPQMYSMHMTGWKAGLKTGLYYLRTKPVAKPIQFTVTSSATQTVAVAGSVEKEEEEEGCLSCGA